MTFTETDLELVDATAGRTIHVNTTGVKRAGTEQVAFGGTTNLFDVLDALADDLANAEALGESVVVGRLENHLADFDRHHDNVLNATGNLGARSARLRASQGRVEDLEVQLQGMLGEVVDADLAEVASQLTQSEYLLQIAQASGARLLQTSLLSFLG